MDKIKIILYTTHCPMCKALKMKLDEQSITYTCVDNVEEMLKLGIRNAPVLSVDGKLLNYREALLWLRGEKE